MRLDIPRVQPVTDEEADDSQQVLFERLRQPDGDVLGIFRTLANHADLARRWMVFGTHVLAKSTLSARVRELLILRVGWVCKAEYEWGQHVVIARGAGITDDEIRRVQAGPEAAGWSDDDRALLRAADELLRDQFISDQVWADLAKAMTTEQILDLIFTVGQYNLVSMALNSLGVQLEEGAPTFRI